MEPARSAGTFVLRPPQGRNHRPLVLPGIVLRAFHAKNVRRQRAARETSPIFPSSRAVSIRLPIPMRMHREYGSLSRPPEKFTALKEISGSMNAAIPSVPPKRRLPISRNCSANSATGILRLRHTIAGKTAFRTISRDSRPATTGGSNGYRNKRATTFPAIWRR